MSDSAVSNAPIVSVFAAASADGDGLWVPQWQAADWSTFFAYADLVTVPRGSVLIQKDAVERALYFVVSGLLEVTTILGGLSMSSIAKVRPGSVVGELAFFDGRPRSAKVWAIADSQLQRVEFKAFDAFCADHPQLACNLLLALARVVSLRLRNAQAQRARG